MFFLYFCAILAVLAGFCLLVQGVLDHKNVNNEDGFLMSAFVLGFIALCCVAVGGIASLVAASTQTYDSVNLTKIKQFEFIYQNKANNLTQQFAHYLADAYPNHEKDIFDKIKPGDVDIYLVKYPELQASKTITELVGQIRSLNDDVYKQQLERAETLRNMKYREKNPWLFQWFIPVISLEQTEK